MKKYKRVFSLVLAVAVMIAMTGCTGEKTPAQPQNEAKPNETVLFTDATGRKVEIPANIERIAPSGPLATVVLYALCPDKIVGIGSEIADEQRPFLDPGFAALPVFGNFYADTLNLEAVMSAAPQIVIDIGEIKDSAAEDMKGVQEKTGIPSILIHMELGNMAEAYRLLGSIVGEEQQAEKLAAYIEETLADAKAKAAFIADAQRAKVYYGLGGTGLTGVVDGTIQADVIDCIGAVNVANVPETVFGGASEISMEQLMLWQPDVILLETGSIFDDISSRIEWQEIRAVQDDRVYEVPMLPYNWLGRLPSVNRILGIKWLGNLVYPDVFEYDMVRETQAFYSLFYHVEITEAQAQELLSSSTLK